MSIPIEKLQELVDQALKSMKKRNFAQSIDLIISLRDFDVNKPESRINEIVELPHPPKKAKVCIIASGELATAAKNAGADKIIDKDELEKFAGNKKAMKKLAKEYDFFLAEGPLMPAIGRILGPSLGPRGKMPTIVPTVAQLKPLLEKHRRSVRIRIKDLPIIQCKVGSEKMSAKEVSENISAVLSRMESRLERGVKNIDKIYVKTTMGKPASFKL